MSNKRSITLIEMMIVIALIAAALGAMAFPISKALKGEQFAHGVDGVISTLMLAQEVMLDFHTDVKLTLKEDEEHQGIRCNLTAATRLPPHIERALNYQNLIKGIEHIALNGEIKKNIEISFDGTLGSISQGKLTLMAPGKEEIITLPGYPRQIRRGMDVHKTTCAHYPEEIISAL